MAICTPVIMSRPQSVPGAPHDTVLWKGDDSANKSAHGCDHGQPENVGPESFVRADVSVDGNFQLVSTLGTY